MPESPSIRPARPEDSSDIAALHCKEIPRGLLSSLGQPLVASFYDALISSPIGFAFLASENGHPVGFACGLMDWREFYRKHLQQHLRTTAQTAMESVLEGRGQQLPEPSPLTASIDLPTAELISVAVDSALPDRQVELSLIRSVLDEFAVRGVPAVRVTAGGSNTYAHYLFTKSGFQRYAEVEVFPDEVMVIYVIVLDGSSARTAHPAHGDPAPV